MKNKSLTKLALLTNSFFNVTKIMDIEPEAFDPAPRVMSSIIKLITGFLIEFGDGVVLLNIALLILSKIRVLLTLETIKSTPTLPHTLKYSTSFVAVYS